MKKVYKEIFSFFIMVNIISCLLWLPALLTPSNNELSSLTALLVKAGDFIPSSISILLTALTLGKSGLGELFKRTIDIRLGLRWHCFALLLMPFVLVTAYLLSYFIADLKFNSLLAPIIFPKIWTVFLLIVYFIIMQGPLGEELGWRGYALPRLLSIMSPMSSSIVLGLVWSVWHLPKFFMEDTIQHSITLAYGIGVALIGYTIYTILLTITMTILFIKTNGSVFGALVFHAMSNFSHGLVTILTDPIGGLCILIVMLIATMVLIKLYGRNLYEKTTSISFL